MSASLQGKSINFGLSRPQNLLGSTHYQDCFSESNAHKPLSLPSLPTERDTGSKRQNYPTDHWLSSVRWLKFKEDGDRLTYVMFTFEDKKHL